MKVITDKTSNKNIANMIYVSYFDLIPKINFRNGMTFNWDEKIVQIVDKFALEKDIHYGFVRKIDFLRNINNITKGGISNKHEEKLFLIGQHYIDGFRWMVEGKKKIISFKDSALFPINSMNFYELLALLTITFPSIFRYKKEILRNSGFSTFLEYIKWLSATNREYVAEKYMKMYNNNKIAGGFDNKKEFRVVDEENISFYSDFRKDLSVRREYVDHADKFTVYKFFFTMENFFNIDIFYSSFILQRLFESLLIKTERGGLKANIDLGASIKEKFILYIKNQKTMNRKMRENFLYSLINSIKDHKFTFKCICGGRCIKIDKYSLKCLKCRKHYVFPPTPGNKDFWKILLIKNSSGIYFDNKGKRMLYRMENNKKDKVVQCVGILGKA